MLHQYLDELLEKERGDADRNGNRYRFTREALTQVMLMAMGTLLGHVGLEMDHDYVDFLSLGTTRSLTQLIHSNAGPAGSDWEVVH